MKVFTLAQLPILIAASFLPAAYSQSNVVLYGVADTAIGRLNSETGLLSSTALNPGPSRIGFRGTEDLGQGLKASFQFEQGIRLNDGRTDAATFARQAWVGLSSPYGTLRLGRQLTATFDAVAAWDTMEALAYSGVGTIFGYGGGSRESAMLKYISPVMAGLQLELGYVFKDNYNTYGPFSAFGTDSTNGKYDIALIYKAQKLTAGLTYSQTSVNTGAAHKSKIENMSIGASYDFGPLKAAASYHHNDQRIGVAYAAGTYQSPGIHGGSFGVTIPLQQLSLSADAVYAKERASTKKSGTDFVFTAKHMLSKRTSVYGVYRYADKSGPSFGGTFKKESNFALGIRHTF